MSKFVACGFAAVLLAGCSNPTAVASPTATVPSQLEAYAGFPVDATPRPLVLITGPVNDPYAFDDDTAKIAYLAGDIARPASFPAPANPARSGGLPLISAEAAYHLLRSSRSSPTPGTVPLTVISIALEQAAFMTDRGEKTLPAWFFNLSGAHGAAAVLALTPGAQWSVPGGRYGDPGIGANVSVDHRTLTWGFIGAPAGTGPCTANYSLKVTESRTAILVRLVTDFHQPPPNTACTLVGYPRTATGLLAKPLGARIVVDARSGLPVEVTGSP